MKDSGVKWIGEIPEEWDIVRLKSLFDFGKGLPITKENLVEILEKPENSIILQYKKLFLLDGNQLEFTRDALLLMAETAYNTKTGARGLRSILEKVMLDIMYDCGGKENEKIKVTKSYVDKKLIKLKF